MTRARTGLKCTRASPPTTAASSPRLNPMFENGSGDELLVRRVAAFGVCARRLVHPASNPQQCSCNRAKHRMNGVPDRIDPRNFVGEEFQEIENACDGDDPWVAQDLQRLVLRRESNPVKMNCQPGDENCQVKIDSGERGKTQSDREQIEPFHEGTIQRS